MDLEFAFNLIKVEGMWCLLYMLVTLCVGDLGVIGVQPDFALGNDIGRNKLNFGCGVNYVGTIGEKGIFLSKDN